MNLAQRPENNGSLGSLPWHNRLIPLDPVLLPNVSPSGKTQSSSKKSNIRSERSTITRLVVCLEYLGSVDRADVGTHDDPDKGQSLS